MHGFKAPACAANTPWLRNDLGHGAWSGMYLVARRYVQERDAKDCFGQCVMGTASLSSLQFRLPYPMCQRHAAELPRMINLFHTSTRSVVIFAMLLNVVILKVQVVFKAIRSKLTYVGGTIAKT